jgi:CDP-6-deoxy-D-xylo-4-hexulose-3-dehydrase
MADKPKKPIKLMKSTFYNENETKQKLVDFIMRSETLSMGKETKRFEEAFAEKQGRNYAVMVNSGSSANLILLQALINLGKLKKGDKVGISALTWATNVMPIIQLGLVPVALDCELETLNISSRILKESIKDLDALFLTNVLGFSDDIPEIKKLCEAYDVVFIEDNCESLGSKIAGILLGNFGLASTFSFFVGHHLSTVEGGMVCTDDEELYHMLLMARAHGWDRHLPDHKVASLRDDHNIEDFFGKYTFYDLAYNVRPTDIQGFIGTTQLPYWDIIVKKREDNFNTIHEHIIKNSDLLPLTTDHMDIISNFAIPLIFKNKQKFNTYKDRFHKHHIEIRPIIAGDITKQPFYKKYSSDSSKENNKNSDYIHKNAFYFGNNPELTEEEIALIIKLIKKTA